ncbi:hypothetical protein JEQ12_019030 [Ovis aries]|uniref:Uncharacterized protein n=1 Tax=Ovis aries TaxID=9940 RepID=A0A836ADM6_SHEEP|nr:hypothetical protein JEQ12_019030 [Ovis aries]
MGVVGHQGKHSVVAAQHIQDKQGSCPSARRLGPECEPHPGTTAEALAVRPQGPPLYARVSVRSIHSDPVHPSSSKPQEKVFRSGHITFWRYVCWGKAHAVLTATGKSELPPRLQDKSPGRAAACLDGPLSAASQGSQEGSPQTAFKARFQQLSGDPDYSQPLDGSGETG